MFTCVVERLVVGFLALLLEFGVVAGHRLLVHRQAQLVGVDQGQKGSQHHLGEIQSRERNI